MARKNISVSIIFCSILVAISFCISSNKSFLQKKTSEKKEKCVPSCFDNEDNDCGDSTYHCDHYCNNSYDDEENSCGERCSCGCSLLQTNSNNGNSLMKSVVSNTIVDVPLTVEDDDSDDEDELKSALPAVLAAAK